MILSPKAEWDLRKSILKPQGGYDTGFFLLCQILLCADRAGGQGGESGGEGGAGGEGCQELCTTSNISLTLLAPTTSPDKGRKRNEFFSLIIHTN